MKIQLPKLMKAAVAKNYGDIDEMLSVSDSVPVPQLDDEYKPTEPINPLIQYATKTDRKTHMLLRTLAVSIAPGDCRVLSGRTREMQGPPSLPYVPGGDCCGIVVETQDGEEYFKPGDLVAARFTVAPRDAMGEYARVSTTVCEKLSPDTELTPDEAAALASASPAVAFSEQIQPKERILVLGAGGGVGAHFCQLARAKGVSYICGVSRTPDRLLKDPIGCDDAIDYTKEDVFASKKYQDEPFDAIYDLACGGWPNLVDVVSNQGQPSIVKPATQGGRFVAMTPDKPTFDGHSFLAVMGIFLFKPMWRTIWSRLFGRSKLPAYSNVMGLPDTRDVMTQTLSLADNGSMKTVIDGIYPLTTTGVRQAFRRLESRHAQGKVVVHIADEAEVRKELNL